MTITYTDGGTTNLDRVRSALGDTATDAGPRPLDANYTDATINDWILLEGNWQRAVAAGYERLAAEWMRFPSFRETNGLSLNRSDIAKGFLDIASTWRVQFGRAIPVGVAGQITKDGYSDDIASDEMALSSSEYDPSFAYVVPA